MTCEILLGRWVLLLHLFVQILQDLDVLPCVLDVGRDLQGAEDQAVLWGFTDGDVRSAISWDLVVHRKLRRGPQRGSPKDLRHFLMVGRIAIHDCRLLFLVNTDHNPVHVWHGRYPYLFDDVLLRLIARSVPLANQRICKMALCLKTPVTLRWTREL